MAADKDVPVAEAADKPTPAISVSPEIVANVVAAPETTETPLRR